MGVTRGQMLCREVLRGIKLFHLLKCCAIIEYEKNLSLGIEFCFVGSLFLITRLKEKGPQFKPPPSLPSQGLAV